MICIYEKTETSFTYNGLGTLEPTYCSYSLYINDVWKLEMYLPYDPEGKYKLVANGRILKVTGIDCIQEQTSDYQLFSIETYRKEGNSIYVLAYPVGMDARFDTYANQVNANYKTASEAIALINGVKAITLDNQQIDKYTVSTDIDSADRNSAVWSNTNIIAMLTNDENGFIHKWGGEVCYDNYNIKVNQALGRTSGASEVRYGKNIRGMSYEEDTSNVITRLYPVANGGETLNAIEEYKIADTQYVDSANVREYPIPHIAYTNAPFNLVQMSNDGSTNYVVTFAAYELIRDTAANWLNDALLGENTGGVDGLLFDIELAWFVDNYALTLANDGTEGLAEYVTNNICNDGLNPIHSASVKNLIYESVKAGFELVLKDDTSAAYVGPASKKMWDAPLGDHFYSYTWDSAGNYRVNKNGDADYAWVYASNKWQQLNDDGITTGTVDTAKWKWYKVSGKSFKRYGNKKKKRYLKNQWWNISGVWYLFGSDGKGKSGAELQESCYEDFDVTYVNDKTIYEVLSPICKEMESDLFDILYSQMTDYCTNMFAEEKISFPTPSISIDMVDLSKTVEYAGYEHLLKIKLGDAVNCINTKLNISTDLRITGLTYDVIKGCNTTIQIGLTETSIIRELDRPNTDSLLEKQGLIAGHGIRIVGNVISATGMNLTDVFVNGQSAVYGGKAYIDLDEISGEGLQWFEETEDALFGVVDEMAIIKDPAYKNSTAGNIATLTYDSNPDGVLTLTITGDNSTIMMYYPQSYSQRSLYMFGNTVNKGYILVLSKSNISVHSSSYSPGSIPELVYSDFDYATMENGNQAGYIIVPDVGPVYGYFGPWAYKGSAIVNGETWYGMIIGDQGWLSSSFRSLITYLPLSEYPEPIPPIPGAYEDFSAVISATVSLTKELNSNNFTGISREGNLAFFAGADDEHGTNAPVRIYRDGTYTGLDKVEDVKVNGVSVVSNKNANIDLSEYVTESDLNSKQNKLTPLLGMTIDNEDNIYLGAEVEVIPTHSVEGWTAIHGNINDVSANDNHFILNFPGVYALDAIRFETKLLNITSFEYTVGVTPGTEGGIAIGLSENKYDDYGSYNPNDFIVSELFTQGTYSGSLDCSGITGEVYLYIMNWYSDSGVGITITTATSALDLKQDKLIAGSNIVINDNVISATGGNSGGSIAYKCLTNAQYIALSSVEKSNGVLYFVSSNANGESGFFTPYKNVSAQPQTSEEVMALVSDDANGSMGIDIIIDDILQNNNLLYFISRGD